MIKKTLTIYPETKSEHDVTKSVLEHIVFKADFFGDILDNIGKTNHDLMGKLVDKLDDVRNVIKYMDIEHNGLKINEEKTTPKCVAYDVVVTFDEVAFENDVRG